MQDHRIIDSNRNRTHLFVKRKRVEKPTNRLTVAADSCSRHTGHAAVLMVLLERSTGHTDHLPTNSERKTTKKGVTRSLIPWT